MSNIDNLIFKDRVCLERRRFVQGMAMAGAFTGLGYGSNVLAAATN